MRRCRGAGLRLKAPDPRVAASSPSCQGHAAPGRAVAAATGREPWTGRRRHRWRDQRRARRRRRAPLPLRRARRAAAVGVVRPHDDPLHARRLPAPRQAAGAPGAGGARSSAVAAALAPLDLDRREAPLGERRRDPALPSGAVSRARSRRRSRRGLVALDADTRLSPGSLDAARRGVGGCVAAVDAVLGGEARTAFVACRPPGHHAERETAMGFCLFGNVAIAAKRALDHHGLERVAIVDFDVHHGNGTQALMWDEPRVLFVSTHQMPLYPGTGRDPRGRGARADPEPAAGAGDGLGADAAGSTRTRCSPRSRSRSPS